jgi:cellulose synthase/poly-beta-1,6-N-acetylglucosamine synthase-like glycosyltransferase
MKIVFSPKSFSSSCYHVWCYIWQSAKKPMCLWEILLYTHTLLLGLPTLFYWCLQQGGVSLMPWHFVVATVYLISACTLMHEATLAVSRRFATHKRSLLTRANSTYASVTYRIKRSIGFRGAELLRSSVSLPRCSFIVAAYLPNEESIILETLNHLLSKINHSSAGLEIILAYNTPVDMPIEKTLKALAYKHPELILHRVEGSRSKAENVNSALNIVTGEITCILDADHKPNPDCFERAWRWLTNGYHVVQGHNAIRNHAETALTRLIALEFESIYAVSHSAKSFMVDTAIFGGSNGYWRTEVLRRIRFNPTMLTEDIDASMRTLLQGYRIIHDRSISVTELAPTDLKSFWSQRKRWSQGWLEVSLKYQRQVWKSKKFSITQKIFWSYMLYYRELFPLVSAQVIPLMLSQALLTGGTLTFDHPYLWITTLITLLSGCYQTLITFKLSGSRYPRNYFISYIVLLPFYTMLKNMIAIVAIYDYLRGQSDWVVTPRQQPTESVELSFQTPSVTSARMTQSLP